MKRVLTIFVCFLLCSFISHAQNGRISGKVTDSETGKPVAKALIEIKDIHQSSNSDADGNFELKNIPYGKYVVGISLEGYQAGKVNVEVISPAVTIPAIKLSKVVESAESAGITEVNLSALDVEDENKEQSTAGLLHASEDVFLSTAGYTFSSVYYRQRGYDSENNKVMINGVEAGDPETGRITWSNWGGLNDAMRDKEVFNSLARSPYSFSSPGGMTFINTRASDYRKQIKLSYSLTNKMYRNRVMLTYATGMTKSGWALTLSGSRRWAQEGYVEGTFYDAWSYFLAAEKKFNDQHSLALTVFGAPTIRGQQAGSVQEAYDLTDNKFYNPNWGYQNGEKRNAKIKQFHEPVFILNHYWTMNEKTKLTTTLSYTFGQNNWSALNWYNSADPRPGYYRYLPSYDTSSYHNAVAERWANDESVHQINWDALYQANYLANFQGQSARYIQENNESHHKQISFSTVLDKEITDHASFTGGLNFSLYNGRNYKTLKDLLGANYWLDIDQFAQRDFKGDTTKLQNDIDNPNRKIKVGDKFGYDYESHINDINLWGQGNFTYDKIDFFLSGSLTGVQYWRTGYMRNGRHANNSKGDSEKQNFLNFGLKGGLTYKINGRNFVELNAIYMTRAPYFSNAFISPRISNDVVPDLKNETIFGAELNYIVRYPWLTARLTGYYTRFLHGTDITSYYHDDYLTYVYYTLTGIDKTHQGIEFGAQVKATKSLSFSGVASIGDYYYTSRPMGTVTFENGSRPDTSQVIYQKNFHVPSTPQTALSLGLKYSYKYWYLDIDGSYYDNSWLEFFPGSRTQQAIDGLGYGDPKIKAITEQSKLKGGFVLDASIGKSIRINYKYFISINFSVNNILNNTDIQTGGFEQRRFDFTGKNQDKFPPKYYYLFGRSYFLNVSFRI